MARGASHRTQEVSRTIPSVGSRASPRQARRGCVHRPGLRPACPGSHPGEGTPLWAGYPPTQGRLTPPESSWSREGPSSETEERCHEAERRSAFLAGGCGHRLCWTGGGRGSRVPALHLEAEGGPEHQTLCGGNATRLEPESLLRRSSSPFPDSHDSHSFHCRHASPLEDPAAGGMSAGNAGPCGDFRRPSASPARDVPPRQSGGVLPARGRPLTLDVPVAPAPCAGTSPQRPQACSTGPRAEGRH